MKRAQKVWLLCLGLEVAGYGCTAQSGIDQSPSKVAESHEDPFGHMQPPPPQVTPPAAGDASKKVGDIDVGGYSTSGKQEAASQSSQSPPGAGTNPASPPPTPKPPPKGLLDSERHPGDVTFQSRLQPFTLTITSFVGSKTVKSQEFRLRDNDRAPLKVESLCETEGRTCLVVTIAGGANLTAGKSICAPAKVKSPTEVFINSDPDGLGIFARCFDGPDDLEDAFTISCPQSKEVVLNDCGF